MEPERGKLKIGCPTKTYVNPFKFKTVLKSELLAKISETEKNRRCQIKMGGILFEFSA